MSIRSNRLNCKPAQLCYYDLLDTETAESVPEDVREHVDSCADCQSDMSQLKDVLASAGKRTDSEQSRRDSAVTELLSLHFAWVDKVVTCGQAKPFLPSMADPLLRIRIPTPITAHIDNCRACREELSTLEDSGLSHKQLCRLSRILAEDPGTEADIEEIRAAFPPVEGMIERPDSGIETRFTFRESVESGPGEIRADVPIEVEVSGSHDDSTDRKLPASIVKLKHYFGPAIAAAAVVLVGLAFFLNGSAARAVGVKRVYEAIKGADNIHISIFTPGRTEPVEEKWMSRSRGIYMSRTAQALVLWDIPNGLRKRKETVDAATEVEPLTKDGSAEIRQLIDGTLGVTPSADVSDLPLNHKWSRVTDSTLESESQDCEIYDLTWPDRNNILGKPVSWRWRYFVESGSGLPRRVKASRRLSADEKYVLQRDTVVEYLADGEIETAVKGPGL